MLPRFLFTAFALLAPSLALAHTGSGDTTGLNHGFSHPFSGLDHILVMVGVGIFAAQFGGRALWLLPLSVLMMVGIGGVLGFEDQITIPAADVQIIIAVSVIAFGLAIALEMSLPIVVAVGTSGFFALVHGYAHGFEMPDTVSGLEYGAGFLCATAILQVMGIGIGLGYRTYHSGSRILRLGGALMVVAGIVLLSGAA
jgi:urease accessory protein